VTSSCASSPRCDTATPGRQQVYVDLCNKAASTFPNTIEASRKDAITDGQYADMKPDILVSREDPFYQTAENAKWRPRDLRQHNVVSVM